MIHVSGSCNPTFHATGSYYIAADTNAFMQFIQGDLFKDFPDLKLDHSLMAAARFPITGGAIAALLTC